jgi:two-component system sensor histidine kinase KdpD
LIDHLLNVSQIQAGVFQIQVTPRPFRATLDVARDQLHTLTAGHEFKVNLPDDLPDVLMDERRVAQVITNIVGNAAKYAPPGTQIALTTFTVDGRVQVEIHDQGPGIPTDRRESVFEPFEQVGMRAYPGDGVGLGLAICKGIVAAHKGRIWIKNDPRPGTTVAFTLPVAGTSSQAK